MQTRDELEPDMELILRPRNGVLVKLEPRELLI